MKNIHILPTDNPSRLLVRNDKPFIIMLKENSPFATNETHTYQNIYITNDEEIKEGDWCYYLNNFGGGNIVCQAYKHPKDERMLFDDGKHNRKIGEGITPISGDCKKIVLTTDSILIEDGIQEIPMDFLEWLVQNPSCEEAEVFHQLHKDEPLYKIIIPKEEPKTFKELFANTGIEPTTDESGNIQYNFKATMKEEPKQETLDLEFYKKIVHYQVLIVNNKGEKLAFKQNDKWTINASTEEILDQIFKVI
jgi:hypothetical protein